MTQLQTGEAKLFREHPVPMLIYDITTKKILDANIAAIDKYGYTRQEFCKLTLDDIRFEVEDSVQTHPEAQATAGTGVFDIQRHRTKEGKVFYTQIFSPLHFQSDKETRLAYLNDITESVEAKKKLENAYFELQHHIDQSPLALVKVDPEFNITEWSRKAERISGFTANEVIGETPFTSHLFEAEDAVRIRNRFMEIKHGEKKNDQIETRFLNREGDSIPIQIHVSALRDKSGNLVSILNFIEDITEQKYAEQKLRKHNTLIEFFQELSFKLNQQQSYEKALSTALADICKFLDYSFGHIYEKKENGEFTSARIFHIENDEKYEPFKRETLNQTFVEGKGFVGNVIYEGRPLAIEDLPNSDLFIRRVSFDDLIVRNGFAIPIQQNNEVFAVIEFFTHKPDSVDLAVIEFFSTIASHLGTVLNKIKTHEELKHSEYKFKQIFDGANDGIFIIKEFKFIECNRQVAELFGYPKEEIIGKTPFDFSPDVQPDGEKSREKAEKVLRKVVEDNKPQIFEWQMTKKDGTLFDVEVSLSRMDMYDDVYEHAVVRDITKQKKAQFELKKREQLFRNLFLKAPAGLVMVDKENRIQMVNESFKKLFGYTEDEITGKDIDKLIVPEEEYETAPKMPAKEFRDSSFYEEAKRLDKEGNPIDVIVGSIPVYIDNEPFAGFGMYIDISQEKEIQKKLKDSLEEKEILLTEIHHRVKNNLAVISGLLELKAMNIDDKDIQTALKESQLRIHTMALIHEKLYQTENFGRLKFRNYANKLMEVVSQTLEQTDKEIQVEIMGDNVELTINQAIPAALIVNELVSNAYEHAFDGMDTGKIWVQISEDEQGIVSLVVEDNGRGLPQKFDELQLSSLGMTLVEKLTEQLSGTLETENNPGAKFTLSFKKSRVKGSGGHYLL